MDPITFVHGMLPVYLAFAPGFDLGAIKESFAYVLDGRGWKMFKRNGVSTALIPVAFVSGLAELEQSVVFTATKIPLDLIRRVTAWFHAVYEKHKAEAVGYLYYCPADGAWEFLPPTQTVTAASAKYEAAPKREGWVVVGTIHSHASMSAFHSGVDDSDEAAFDGVHITIGRLDSVPEFSCSLVVQGTREKFDPSELIDGMAPADAVPTAWLEAVKLQPPRGLPAAFAPRGTRLYGEYYAGKISEAEYELGLSEIQKAAEQADEAEIKKALAAPAPAEGERSWLNFGGKQTASRKGRRGKGGKK